MRKATLLTALLLLATNTAWAQFTESDPLDSTGFVQERLGKIDAVINAEITSGKIPGAVALIVKNGQLAYFKSFGFADIDTQTPMEKDNIFRLASMTKAITFTPTAKTNAPMSGGSCPIPHLDLCLMSISTYSATTHCSRWLTRPLASLPIWSASTT